MTMTGAIDVLTVEPKPSTDAKSASVSILGLGERPIRIDVSANVSLDSGSGPWVPATLLVAMKHGAELKMEGPVDDVALANAVRAQQVLASWYDDLQVIEIRRPEQAASFGPISMHRGVGCFFSGGVDSFYSAIERDRDISHLIFVTGFDIDVEDEALAAEALEAARAGARSLGKELIEVRTNIRQMSEGVLDWGTHYHGAALATVGLLLGSVLRRVIIPASYHVDDLFPWGSHPDLDSLWSSSMVTFEHHGESATRPEKVARIAMNDAAMDHLRICWENPGGAFNCGKCEKCIRTMVNLRVVDRLERCRTLPNTLDIKKLRSFRPDHGAAVFAKQNLEAIRAHGIDDSSLIAALNYMVRMAPIWELARTVRSTFRKVARKVLSSR